MTNLNLILTFFLVLGFINQPCIAQTVTKMGAFKTLVDFQKDSVFDSIRVEIVDVNNVFTPRLCKPYPVMRTDYYYSNVVNNISVLSNGKDLLLNLKIPGIQNGFVRLKNDLTYNCFMSRKPKHDKGPGIQAYVAFGLVGYAIHEISREKNPNKSQPYVFNMNTAKLYVLNELTVERLLEPFPELSYIYSTDPNKSDIETMVTYLEILGETEKASTK